MAGYRSRLEERVARWLKLNGHQFEYETLKLNYTLSSVYTPDFIMPNGVILEAKGYFKPEDRRKMLAVKSSILILIFDLSSNLHKILSRKPVRLPTLCGQRRMVFCGHHHTTSPMTGSMISTATASKEEILKRLGEHFADTLVECLDYVHTKDISPDDIAKLIIDELEDWMAYHASMTNAAELVRHALRERVS
jgi:hypothetical protein